MLIIAYKYLNELNKQTIIYGVVLGIFLFLGFTTQTFGLTFTKSSIVAFLTGLNVVIVPFLAYFLFKNHVRKMVFVGSLIAVVGLYLLTMSEKLTLGIGEILTLFCATFFALQIIFTDKYSKKVNVFLLVLFQLLTVSILSLIFSLSLDSVTFSLDFDYIFIKAILITSVFATVYAFLVQTYMQQFTTPTKTAIIFTMEPVSAGFYGYFTANETFNKTQLIGAVLILFAVLLSKIKFKTL